MKIRAIIYLTLLTYGASAQEYEIDPDEIYRSPVRAILNQFSISVTTGYNSTKYSQNLSGFYYLQSATQQYITQDLGEVPGNQLIDVYENWFNNPRLVQAIVDVDTFDVPFPPISSPVLNPDLKQGLRPYHADSLGLGFEGKGWGIPINLSLRYNYQKFRVGFGFNMEFHKIKEMESTRPDLGIRNYVPNFSSAFFYSYYFQVGYRFYDYWDYSFAAELEFGKNKMGKHFNKSLIRQGMFANFGISIEKNLSEYFRIIVKPSYDFKSYDMAVPGTGLAVKHKNPSFKINFGISITIPEIPRSPMKSDHVQLKHVYTDPTTGRYMEVRGQPIWKKQNPKVGENHRKLWRYKFKNKKKINPY